MKTDTCWLCGHKSPLIKEIATPLYFHCPTCDLIFIQRDYILSPYAEKKRYLLHNNTPTNYGYVKYLHNFITEAVTPFNSTIKRGLDFGCGPSPVLSILLKQQGIEMDHYDLFFFPKQVFLGQKYDLITCTEVLEHVHQPKKVLQLFKEHLKPQGILAVMTHFHHNHQFKSWWYRQDKTHICFYSRYTFQWIAQNLNWSILYSNNKNICVMRC